MWAQNAVSKNGREQLPIGTDGERQTDRATERERERERERVKSVLAA